MRLFCFPYSGASAAAVYSRWRRLLPSWIDVRPVELPGRGHRLAEPLHSRFSTLVAKLAEELASDVRTPFAFFGHSLGSIVAFEMAHVFESRYGLSPSMLFLSGGSAPDARDYSRYALPFSNEQLIQELQRLKGTHPEVFENPDLLELTLPILRADFLVCGSYRPQASRPRLRCPIHVFAGAKDSAVGEPTDWRLETTADFGCDVLPGDHFFIHDCESQVLERLVDRATFFLGRGEAPPAAADSDSGARQSMRSRTPTAASSSQS